MSTQQHLNKISQRENRQINITGKEK